MMVNQFVSVNEKHMNFSFLYGFSTKIIYILNRGPRLMSINYVLWNAIIPTHFELDFQNQHANINT